MQFSSVLYWCGLLYYRSGLLSFQQQDSDSAGEEEEEEGFQTTPLHAPGLGYQHLAGEGDEEAEDARDRAPSSVSNTSQQIGRFEVSWYLFRAEDMFIIVYINTLAWSIVGPVM